MKSTRRLPIATLPIHTPEGSFLAHYSDQGLMQLDFPSGKNPLPAWADVPGVRTRISRWHKLTTRALKEALAGKPISKPPPYDLGDTTEFQRQVWSALEKIPMGETRTYSELAREIGNPNAVRAVGRGMRDQSHPDSDSMPPPRGGAREDRRIFRRIKMEGSFASARRGAFHLSNLSDAPSLPFNFFRTTVFRNERDEPTLSRRARCVVQVASGYALVNIRAC